MTKIGHTISIFQLITCCTWRRFSRSWDKDTVSARRVKWRTCLWTLLHGCIYVCHSSSCSSSWENCTENLRSTKNQPLKSLRQLFKWLRGWSRIRQKLMDLTRLTGSSLCGETTLLTDRAVQFATAKTYVFSDSVLCLGGISDEPVKAWECRIISFWKHIISKIWIGSTGSRWSSSGKISQDSLHWKFSTKFKWWWLNQSVNQSRSKEGSSSCQCTMTLIGQDEETKKIVLRTLSELLSMLENSRKDIGRFWCLDPWRNGTEPVDTTPTRKTHLCSTVCSQARTAQLMRLAQELHRHLCALEKNLVIWCVSCLIHGCSLTCLSPRALHLLHSLFLLRHKNTQHNRYSKSNTENTQYIPHISKLPQSTSCAIKNHSGVKTCRVAEPRAPQLPQVMSPRSLRLSQGSELILEIHTSKMMYRRKVGEEDHRAPITEEVAEFRDCDGWLTRF